MLEVFARLTGWVKTLVPAVICVTAWALALVADPMQMTTSWPDKNVWAPESAMVDAAAELRMTALLDPATKATAE